MDELFTRRFYISESIFAACADGKTCSVMGREACSQSATAHVSGRTRGAPTAIRQIKWADYELSEKTTIFGRKILASGGRIRAAGGTLLRRARAPVGTQFSHKVQRARREHDVLRAGTFQGSFQRLAGITHNDRFFGVVAGHFRKQRSGNGARLVWFRQDDGSCVREQPAGNLIHCFIAHRSVDKKNTAAAVTFLPEFQ